MFFEATIFFIIVADNGGDGITAFRQCGDAPVFFRCGFVGGRGTLATMQRGVFICFFISLVFSQGCFRPRGERAVVIVVPEMKCLECAEGVTQAVTALDGVAADSVSCDTDNGEVSLTFDASAIRLKTIKRAIAANQKLNPPHAH